MRRPCTLLCCDRAVCELDEAEPAVERQRSAGASIPGLLPATVRLLCTAQHVCQAHTHTPLRPPLPLVQPLTPSPSGPFRTRHVLRDGSVARYGKQPRQCEQPHGRSATMQLAAAAVGTHGFTAPMSIIARSHAWTQIPLRRRGCCKGHRRSWRE